MSRPLPGFVTKKKGEKTKSQFPLLRFSGTVVYVSESGHCQRLCLNLLRHLNPPAPPQLPPAASDKSQSPQNSAGMDGSSYAGAQEASAPEHTSVLGFDIEWKVIWQKGSAPRPAALLQLCDGDACYLLHIIHCGVPPALVALLGDERILKVGVGISGDVQKLFRDYDLNVRGAVCLSALYNEKLKPSSRSKWSLQRMCQHALKHELEKGKVRLSDWERKPLYSQQQVYAATDAFAGILLYQYVLSLPNIPPASSSSQSKPSISVEASVEAVKPNETPLSKAFSVQKMLSSSSSVSSSSSLSVSVPMKNVPLEARGKKSQNIPETAKLQSFRTALSPSPPVTTASALSSSAKDRSSIIIIAPRSRLVMSSPQASPEQLRSDAATLASPRRISDAEATPASKKLGATKLAAYTIWIRLLESREERKDDGEDMSYAMSIFQEVADQRKVKVTTVQSYIADAIAVGLPYRFDMLGVSLQTAQAIRRAAVQAASHPGDGASEAASAEHTEVSSGPHLCRVARKKGNESGASKNGQEEFLLRFYSVWPTMMPVKNLLPPEITFSDIKFVFVSDFRAKIEALIQTLLLAQGQLTWLGGNIPSISAVEDLP